MSGDGACRPGACANRCGTKLPWARACKPARVPGQCCCCAAWPPRAHGRRTRRPTSSPASRVEAVLEVPQVKSSCLIHLNVTCYWCLMKLMLLVGEQRAGEPAARNTANRGEVGGCWWEGGGCVVSQRRTAGYWLSRHNGVARSHEQQPASPVGPRRRRARAVTLGSGEREQLVPTAREFQPPAASLASLPASMHG